MTRRHMLFFEGDNGAQGGGTPAAAPAGGGTLLGGVAAPAQPAVATPAQGGWTKEDGSFSEGWLTKLPAELQNNPSLTVLGNVSDLAKSYVETKSLIGKKLEAPGEGATPEQLTAWRKTVGAPDKPEGYYGDAKTLRPDEIPEGMWDTAAEKKFVEIAHKHNLTPGAVKEILGFYGGSIAQGLQQSQAQEQQVLAAEGTKLREAWGKEYDGNLALAARVAQTVGLDPKTHPVFTSAEMVQAFAKMGKFLSEDKLVKGEGGSGINATIQDRIRDFTDPKSTSTLARDYRGEFGPERQAQAQRQYHELLAAAQPK